MYKDKVFRIRDLDDIFADIDMAKNAYGDIDKVFLCDGDAIEIDTDMLLKILEKLHKSFPSLRHVGSYAGPMSTLRKSRKDLISLREAGLTKAYLGVESGDDDILKEIKKGAGYNEMLAAGKIIIESGINLSVMVLLGIAGNGERSIRHAEATARICDEMKPQYLAALTLTPVPGTIMDNNIKKGRLKLPDPFETLEEMRIMINNITADNIKFVGTHASNYLPVTGMLQKDKKSMLDTIDHVLNSRDKQLIRNEKIRGL
jgi:radical SAM superfamily enzyme YgiQ (UPF0313 family)